MGKGSKGIEVYVRVRPTKKPFSGLSKYILPVLTLIKIDIDTAQDGSLEFSFQRTGLRHAEIKDDFYRF
jgi:kinesin family protein 6/9